MTITGSTFDRMRVTPINDSRTYYGAYSRNVIVRNVYGGDGFNRTANGLEVTINPGIAMIMGRQVELTDAITLAVPANSKGYLVITIDLSKENTSTGTPGQPDYSPVNNQVSMRVVTTLTQQDLTDGGQVYDFPLYSYTSTGSAVTTYNHGEFGFKPTLESPWEAYSGTPGLVVMNLGDLVWVNGTMTLKSGNTIKAGTRSKIATLPTWAQVSGTHEAIFGSSANHFKIRIDNGKDINFMDWTSKGVYTDFSGGWVNFQFGYLRYNSPTVGRGWTNSTNF